MSDSSGPNSVSTEPRRAGDRIWWERHEAANAVVAPESDPVILPTPPTDDEAFGYFGRQARWPFVWLFISQVALVYGYTMVMRKSIDTWLGLVLLTFMLPPIFVNGWLRIRRHRLTLADHQAQVALWDGLHPPSVDIFLPSCGEDVRVLENTFRRVRAMRWAGDLRVHVLDDADSLEVRRAAARYGFRYVLRPNRGELKKAGNLIHAFESTSGDFIVVFDADFAPRPDFLEQTFPYMLDDRIGVVQTAQYFDTNDERQTYIARYAGVLQEVFFRWIQPARDTYEAAICAGTNVMYRRAAVVAAGGFARVPIGEDVHSGVKIWVAHYRTRYVPLCLAKGLAPDTWGALTNQQYRWCRSSMLLMLSSFFREAPFSWRQRMCFWAAFLYYMASAAIIITSPLPTLVMVWRYPDQVHLWNYLPVVPAVLATFVVFPRLASGWRMPIYRVCTINSFCHVLAVRDAIANRVEAWVPTGAIEKAPRTGIKRAPIPKRVARMLRTWFVVVQTLLWVGVARALRTESFVPFLPIFVLGGLQFVMLVPFLVRLDPRPTKQSAERTVIDLRGHEPQLAMATGSVSQWGAL